MPPAHDKYEGPLHYHQLRPETPTQEDLDALDEPADDDDEVVGTATMMQYRAMEAAAKGEVAPGCSKRAQYQRLRRFNIANGLHVPRQKRTKSRKTVQLREDWL